MSKSGEKILIWEMSNRGNVRSGNCLVGELLYRGCRGNVRSGICLVGELSCRGAVRWVTIRRGTVYWGSVLGEVSVQEVSSRGNVRLPLTV